MADQRISQLNEVTSPSNDDDLPIVSGGETKKVKRSNLVGNPTAGWNVGAGTWTYVSATSINVTSADAAALSVGSKIWLNQSGSKYFYVTGKSSTIITVNGGSDYTVANATITSPYYSNEATPPGFAAPKFYYGLVKSRQGGSAGDASWNVSGTTNVDTSTKAAFFQAGTNAVTGDPTSITFPVPYTYAPIVVANTVTVGAVTPLVRINGITNTGFSVTVVQTNTGSSLNDRSINWIAVGQ